MTVALRIIGTLLIFGVFQDIFFTVLFPASGHGIIRKPILRLIWWVFRLLGGLTHGSKRRNLLSYSGPTVIIITFLMWFLLLILGWAMIYKPALGISILAASGETDTSWATAIYYSGYAFTTLGTGDLLHCLSRSTGDAAELLSGLIEGSDLSNVQQHLSTMANSLRQLYQSHRFYPVLRYFHYREPYYSLPRILLTTLDAVTLLRTTLKKSIIPTSFTPRHWMNWLRQRWHFLTN